LSFNEPTDTLMPGQAIRGSNGTTTLRSANGRYTLVNSATLHLEVGGGHQYANISSGSALLDLTDNGRLVLNDGTPAAHRLRPGRHQAGAAAHARRRRQPAPLLPGAQDPAVEHGVAARAGQQEL